jgi:hypothetical protein
MPDQHSPHVRLELRIAGEPLAWYHEDDLQQASAHLEAVVSHPGATALAQVVRVVPGGPEVVVLSSVPRGVEQARDPGSTGTGAA